MDGVDLIATTWSSARTFGMGALVVTSALGCTVAALYIYVSSSPAARRGFSKGPMGIRSSKKNPRRAHALASVGSDALTVKDWVAPLSRSCRSTINKQIDKAYAKFGVEVHSISPSEMGWDHFWVVYSHEYKAYANRARAFFGALGRFLVAKMMTGVVDEYRISPPLQPSSLRPQQPGMPPTEASKSTKRLIGWSQTVIKGDTLRGMWFYQSEFASSSKMFLWFGSLRAAVARAIAVDGCKWVDLGPSANERVSTVKAKYGFEITKRWNDKSKNDYHTGPFCENIPLYQDLTFA